MEELRADPNNADVSKSTLAKYAAEMIKADRAATELKNNYASLMKDLSGVNGKDAKTPTLVLIKDSILNFNRIPIISAYGIWSVPHLLFPSFHSMING